MLQPRVIPCLLLHNGGLVKTVKFKKPCYVGDPINTVKIFNEKEVDELMIFDIDATIEQRDPFYGQIEDIVSEAFFPVCYGGGVKSVEQMHRLFTLGVEKISISSAVVENPMLIEEAAKEFGSQSIVVTLDVKKTLLGIRYNIVTYNATRDTGQNVLEMAKRIEKLGAGEISINNVDHDGCMQGYDINLIKQITNAVKIPVIALGGAGTINDLQDVVKKGGASAASAGSLFIFHGKYRAVLINYPTREELNKLFQEDQ